jgi:hypothetical protein
MLKKGPSAYKSQEEEIQGAAVLMNFSGSPNALVDKTNFASS